MNLKRWIALFLTLVLALSLAACGEQKTENGKPGNDKPVNGKVTLQFWGWGDDVESAVFQEITDRFNETVGAEKGITVKYVQKASSSYSSDTALALSSIRLPAATISQLSGKRSLYCSNTSRGTSRRLVSSNLP